MMDIPATPDLRLGGGRNFGLTRSAMTCMTVAYAAASRRSCGRSTLIDSRSLPAR